MCRFCVGYKNRDVKTAEVVARGRVKKTGGSEARTGWVFCSGDLSDGMVFIDFFL